MNIYSYYEKVKCKNLLTKNGWEYVNCEEYQLDDNNSRYIKENYVAVDFCDEIIVILDDTGDIINLPLNVYALFGFLFHFRQLDINYKTWWGENE